MISSLSLSAHSLEGRYITAVQWYPVDSGLFMSASMDAHVRLWDANEFAVAADFPMGNPCYAARMHWSGLLIAVGTMGADVHLVDPRSGGATHVRPHHLRPPPGVMLFTETGGA